MQTLGKPPSAGRRRKRVKLRHVAILVLALALGGCAAFSAGGMSASGARFRHAVRQGWQSGQGLTLYVIPPEEFPQGSSFAAIRDVEPSNEGAQLLRDQVLTDVTIANTVTQLGLPAAIGYASSAAGQVQRLAMMENSLGPEHPLVAQALYSLAALYWAQGQYAEAEPPSEKLLTLIETVLGPDHPDFATSLNNLAVLYREQGKYAKAESVYKRALASLEKLFGPDDARVGAALSGLAVVYREQGRYSEADTYFKRALPILEKSLDPDHPNVETTLENYAQLLRKIKRDAEAVKLEARVKAIRAKQKQRNP